MSPIFLSASTAVFLDDIGELFGVEQELEKQAKKLEPIAAAELRRQVRDEKSRAIVNRLGRRAAEAKVLPRSPIAQAIKYLENRWDGLVRFVDDPRVPLTSVRPLSLDPAANHHELVARHEVRMSGSKQTGPSLAGGAAASGGFDFQARAAAWFMVRMLAEREGTLGLGLPDTTVATALACETTAPVDDIFVETSQGGVLLCQAKRTLSASQATDSSLAGALAQFVRQWLVSARGLGGRPWERSLNAARDRLLLTVSPEASSKIRVRLRDTLARLPAEVKNTIDWESLRDSCVCSQDERDVADLVWKHISTAWDAAVGGSPSVHDALPLLRLLRVQELALHDGADERSSLDLLKNSVLAEAEQATLAWEALIELGHVLCAEQRSTTIPELSAHLGGRGVRLRGSPAYREDLASLRQYTERIVSFLGETADIEGQRLARASTECRESQCLRFPSHGRDGGRSADCRAQDVRC